MSDLPGEKLASPAPPVDEIEARGASGEGDRAPRPRRKQQFKRVKRDVHGWVVLD